MNLSEYLLYDTVHLGEHVKIFFLSVFALFVQGMTSLVRHFLSKYFFQSEFRGSGSQLSITLDLTISLVLLMNQGATENLTGLFLCENEPVLQKKILPIYYAYYVLLLLLSLLFLLFNVVVQTPPSLPGKNVLSLCLVASSRVKER